MLRHLDAVVTALSTRVGIAHPVTAPRPIVRRDRALPGRLGGMPNTRESPSRNGFRRDTPVLRPLILIAAAVGVLVAGTVALWAHYGTAVFYEMVVAGLAACL